MPKLTLSIDRAAIDKARQLAKERGMSVSALFRQFIERESEKREAARKQRPPLTREALGLVKLPSDKPYRELIEESLAERYGL